MRHNQIINLLIITFIGATIICESCTGRAKNPSPAETIERKAPLISYCESINYADTILLHDRTTMKRIIRNIVKLMPSTDSLSTVIALNKFLSNISGDTLSIENASEFARLFLNNPASPVRDEELYIRFLQSMSEVDGIPEYLRLRTEDQLRKALLNRPGTPANDIKFLDRDGRHRSLYSIDSENIFLIFYDPECPHCTPILKMIAEDTAINEAIADKRLTVAAIYAEGKKDIWKRSCRNMPAQWTVGYDLSGILDNELYDLPAMPIIYILDRDKKVVLKDPPVNQLGIDSTRM